MLNKSQILIIEDDANLSLIIGKHLERQNIETDIAYTGEEGLEKALSNKYNLLLVDIGLPGINGVDIIKRIRNIGNMIPVIIITSQIALDKEIDAYDQGANLFHRKPIEFDLLIAQINSLLPDMNKELMIEMKDIVINTKERYLKRKGVIINLTKTELDFILMLVKSNGSIFSRHKIIVNLLNYNRDLEHSAVDTMVCRIRKKLDEFGTDEFLETVPKEGFRINLNYMRNAKVEASQ